MVGTVGLLSQMVGVWDVISAPYTMLGLQLDSEGFCKDIAQRINFANYLEMLISVLSNRAEKKFWRESLHVFLEFSAQRSTFHRYICY
jgi:hypothetical protein